MEEESKDKFATLVVIKYTFSYKAMNISTVIIVWKWLHPCKKSFYTWKIKHIA